MRDAPYMTDKVESKTYPGWTIEVQRWADQDSGPPWRDDCGSVGVIAERRSTSEGGPRKRPGETIIHQDGSWCHIVDFQAEVKRARQDGWGLSDAHMLDLKRRVSNKQILKTMTMTERMALTHEQRVEMVHAVKLTKRQITARSVELNIKYIKDWLNNRWHYCGLVVKVVAAPPGIEFDPDETNSCYGFDDNDDDYLAAEALSMGDYLISQQLLAHAAAQEAEARRVAEVERTRSALKPVSVQELGVFLDVPDSAAVRADGWVQAWVFAPPVIVIESGPPSPLTRCAAGRDGDCTHAQCPQLADGEPARSDRHCPLDVDGDEA